MLYELKPLATTKKQEGELETAERRMLCFSLGVKSLDKTRNERTRGTAHVGKLGEKLREARLRWCGHVHRRNEEYVGRIILAMELPGKRWKGKPRRRCRIVSTGV